VRVAANGPTGGLIIGDPDNGMTTPFGVSRDRHVLREVGPLDDGEQLTVGVVPTDLDVVRMVVLAVDRHDLAGLGGRRADVVEVCPARARQGDTRNAYERCRHEEQGHNPDSQAGRPKDGGR
jgi:hypothetical protein